MATIVVCEDDPTVEKLFRVAPRSIPEPFSPTEPRAKLDEFLSGGRARDER